LFGRLSRLIGSKLREDKIGRDNLKAAFPEKTPEEIEAILAGVWDNLGRVGAEFAHLDRVWNYHRDHPEKLSNIDLAPRTIELFDRLRNDGKPTLARLLRQVECPVHGVRIIRLPGHRFRGELSEEVKPVRDADGQIDIQGTTQAVTSVVEGWIREYPDQWLWLHRRWR